MRIYKDALEMLKEVERDLSEMGIEYESETVQDQKLEGEDKKTKELTPYAYTLLSNNEGKFEKIEEFLRYKKEKGWEDFHSWVKVESVDRLIQGPNGNPGNAWKVYKDFWGQFIRDGKFSYCYKERFSEQLDYIVNELKIRPNSRQVVMTMYDRHQDMMNWGGRDRVPCSLTYHFLIRKDRLNLIYSQRSCDFFKFFQADVYFGLILLYYIAETLNVKTGNFTHFINSLHVFKKDLEGVF